MKKVLLGLTLAVGVVGLAGCSSATTVTSPVDTEIEGDGLLITVGFDKREWYLSEKTVSVDSYGRTSIEMLDGRSISTNDVVNEYPYKDETELQQLKDKFELE